VALPVSPVSRDLPLLEPSSPASRPPGGASFADELGRAVGQVDALQVEADRQANEIAMGGGNLHEAAIALEKADVALRLMSKVRNKIVDAYQEVMRMGV
jgi:flagellar hook-basal body complex protein FliE